MIGEWSSSTLPIFNTNISVPEGGVAHDLVQVILGAAEGAAVAVALAVAVRAVASVVVVVASAVRIAVGAWHRVLAA